LGTRAISNSAGRLAFADLLRGLAALIVVLGHFTILFLTHPDVVATISAGELSFKVNLSRFVDQLNDLFNVASIGVAVFFLISGFVIPLSLEGTDVRAYFLKRFLRIFPTYWIALAMGTAAIFISATFWSKPIPHDELGLFTNVFLGANALGRPTSFRLPGPCRSKSSSTCSRPSSTSL
jgi:peptidoglycan/LPS O-acetylase OafA/YrhL